MTERDVIERMEAAFPTDLGRVVIDEIRSLRAETINKDKLIGKQANTKREQQRAINRLKARAEKAEGERDHAFAEVEELRGAALKILEGFEKDYFIRNTAHDDKSDWALKFYPFLKALAVLKEAVDAALAGEGGDE